MTALSAQIELVKRAMPMRLTGRVAALRGLTVVVNDLPLPVGAMVQVESPDGQTSSFENTRGEIVGFRDGQAVVMMLGSASGVRPGDRVVGLQRWQTVNVGSGLLGRCIDALGRPIDSLGVVLDTTPRPLDPPPLGPMGRERITAPMYTGVRAVDLMTTIGRGQRLGIFSGPGVGKSTLLSSIAKNAKCDVAVLALVGERGREVKDFIEIALGVEGLKRSVVVASTSDESPLMRLRAALTATTVAEYFRDQGKNVLLLVDSVTRFAHAQRQIGLSVGEPPTTKGYTPSVFAALARLLERAGGVEATPGKPAGSITGLYTILVEGDDMTEPIADAARGILDGHIILSRRLAQKSHFPAIDVLDSISRVADSICDAAHIAARRQVMRLLAAYRDVEDLVQIGAYARGSSPQADVAIAYHQRVLELLQQAGSEVEPFESGRSRMVKLALESGNVMNSPPRQAPTGNSGQSPSGSQARSGGSGR